VRESIGSSRGRTCALAFTCAIALAAATQAKPIATRWFPFDLEGGHIHVPVKVAGVETTAMLDTGASLHMLDREFAEAHGIKFSASGRVEVQAGHSHDRLPVAYDVPIELFGASVALKVVPVSDVPFATLVIGTGVLSSFVMQVDYANSRIRFASRDATNLDEAANVELRRSGTNNWPALRATLDGEDVWLMLDTGLSAPLILTPGFVRDRGWEGDAGTLSIDALGAVKAMDRFRVPLLQLGPYDLRGVVAAVPSEGRLPPLLTASEAGRVRISGILGAEVLRHFVVTLDLKRMRLHLAASQRVEPESWESSVSTDDGAPDESTNAEDATSPSP
jgi:predicted aspartyl protease